MTYLDVDDGTDDLGDNTTLDGSGGSVLSHYNINKKEEVRYHGQDPTVSFENQNFFSKPEQVYLPARGTWAILEVNPRIIFLQYKAEEQQKRLLVPIEQQ